MHILHSPLFSTYWYVFLVLISMGIGIAFYLSGNLKFSRQFIFFTLALILFSIIYYQYQSPAMNKDLEMVNIAPVDEDHFGTEPDFLSNPLQKLYEFIRRHLY